MEVMGDRETGGKELVVVDDVGAAAELEAEIDAMLADAYRIDLESDYWRNEAAQRLALPKGRHRRSIGWAGQPLVRTVALLR